MTKKVIFIGIFLIALIACATAFAYSNVGGLKKVTSPAVLVVKSATATEVSVGEISQTPVRIPIFIYHSIRPNDPALPKSAKVFDTTPDVLEQELQYLHDNGYTTLSMDEFVHTVHTGKVPEGQKPVVLTFDDGLENQYVYALPLLKKYNVKATFFVYPNPVEHNDVRFMSWKNVIEIANTTGMVIGDHTMTHPLLSKATPEDLVKEIVQSKKLLEEKIKMPVVHFASPFGYTSPSLVAFLKENGYVTGRTTTRGTMHTSSDLLSLTGYMPHNTLYDFTWSLEH